MMNLMISLNSASIAKINDRLGKSFLLFPTSEVASDVVPRFPGTEVQNKTNRPDCRINRELSPDTVRIGLAAFGYNLWRGNPFNTIKDPGISSERLIKPLKQEAVVILLDFRPCLCT